MLEMAGNILRPHVVAQAPDSHGRWAGLRDIAACPSARTLVPALAASGTLQPPHRHVSAGKSFGCDRWDILHFCRPSCPCGGRTGTSSCDSIPGKGGEGKVLYSWGQAARSKPKRCSVQAPAHQQDFRERCGNIYDIKQTWGPQLVVKVAKRRSVWWLMGTEGQFNWVLCLINYL